MERLTAERFHLTNNARNLKTHNGILANKTITRSKDDCSSGIDKKRPMTD